MMRIEKIYIYIIVPYSLLDKNQRMTTKSCKNLSQKFLNEWQPCISKKDLCGLYTYYQQKATIFGSSKQYKIAFIFRFETKNRFAVLQDWDFEQKIPKDAKKPRKKRNSRRTGTTHQKRTTLRGEQDLYIQGAFKMTLPTGGGGFLKDIG